MDARETTPSASSGTRHSADVTSKVVFQRLISVRDLLPGGQESATIGEMDVQKFEKFQPAFFEFLEQLADNNNRPWFQENKSRYELEVLEPAMAFIRAFQPRLKRISPHFVASDKRVGGSLMRVYRDTRFVKDGEPYKTNVGIQFRHEQGRDVHAPGFYVHIAPGECFLAAGLWRPEAEPLGQVRQAIVERPDPWRKARDDPKFLGRFALAATASSALPAASRPTIPGSKTSSGRTSSRWKNWMSGTCSRRDTWSTCQLPLPSAGPSCVSSARP